MGKRAHKGDYVDDDESISFVDMLADEVNNRLVSRVPAPAVTTEQLYDKITAECAEMVTYGLETVAALKGRCVQGGDPEALEALGTIMNSTTAAIAELNKLNLHKQRTEAQIALEGTKNEHKLQQLRLRAELAAVPEDGQKLLAQGGTTNVLIATREDIINSMLKPLEASLAERIRLNMDNPTAPTTEVKIELIDAIKENEHAAEHQAKSSER